MTIFDFSGGRINDTPATAMIGAQGLCLCPPASPNAARELGWRRRLAKYLTSVLAVGAILMPLTAQTQAQSPASGSEPFQIDLPKATETVFDATNAYRIDTKLKELSRSQPLWQAAQQYAEFLAANKASGHMADGKTPQQRAEEQGYRCPVAENTYSADPAGRPADEEAEALKAFAVWQQTPADNDNMLSAAHITTGVGAAAWTHEGQIYYVFVQMFGRGCGGGAAPILDGDDGGAIGGGGDGDGGGPVCPVWDAACHGCPSWNPYCHSCPPWDPLCHKCPSWNPYCHKCPPWDPICHKCPPWDLHCHKCPPWNPACHRCPNGGVWPRCSTVHHCPNGGVWPQCGGGIRLARAPQVHHCPNGGFWPRCRIDRHVTGTHRTWHNPRRLQQHTLQRTRGFHRQRIYQRRLSNMRQHQTLHYFHGGGGRGRR